MLHLCSGFCFVKSWEGAQVSTCLLLGHYLGCHLAPQQKTAHWHKFSSNSGTRGRNSSFGHEFVHRYESSGQSDCFYQIQWQSKDIFIFLEQPCFKILAKTPDASFALSSTSQFQPTEREWKQQVIPSDGNGVEVVLVLGSIGWKIALQSQLSAK